MSNYFFESNSLPRSDFRNLDTNELIDFMLYYFIFESLFIQRVIKKPVIKFHYFVAQTRLLMATTTSFCNKNSIILKFLFNV